MQQRRPDVTRPPYNGTLSSSVHLLARSLPMRGFAFVGQLSLVVVFACASPFAARVLAQGSTSPAPGVIEGRVVDAGSGDPLPGAKIVVTGSPSEASPDRDGHFRLSGVAPGDQTVAISYLGRRDETAGVHLTAGATPD